MTSVTAIKALLGHIFPSTTLQFFVESFIDQEDWEEWNRPTPTPHEDTEFGRVLSAICGFPSVLCFLMESFTGEEDRLVWEAMKEYNKLELLLSSPDITVLRLLQAKKHFCRFQKQLSVDILACERTLILNDCLWVGLKARLPQHACRYRVRIILTEEETPDSDRDPDSASESEDEDDYRRNPGAVNFPFAEGVVENIGKFHKNPKDPSMERKLQDVWVRAVRRTLPIKQINRKFKSWQKRMRERIEES